MTSIPASQLVNVQPSVVGTGGSPLALNALFLTNNTSIPIGSVQEFVDTASVSDWFGPTSDEAEMADVYFGGFDNSTIKPGALLFAQYPVASVAAYLRSGSLAGMTLTQLKALSGTIIVSMDGVVKTSSSISLTAATSFSNAATIIAAAFTSGPAVTYDSQLAAFKIASTTTGASSTMTVATGTLAAGLKLTAATGAVLSQGSVAATTEGFMDAIIEVTQNWATFMTIWEPVTDDKVLFAEWSSQQNNRWLYVAWDSDATAIQGGNTTSFGPLCLAAEYNGVVAVWPSAEKAAFICGCAASIDFNRTNGRITFAYKGQSGLTADVTNSTDANNLIANGYNFYGAYATANDRFVFLQPGQMFGEWTWIDPYVNQIYLNSQLQLAVMSLLSMINSLPYNDDGYSSLSMACRDPILQMINFGGIRKGISLSNLQKTIVNTAAGLEIDQMLERQGFYLQILDATAQVRGLRQSPPINLWYTDGGSIHTINIASINVL